MGVSIKSFLLNIKQRSALEKLIIINVSVFLLIGILSVFAKLFNIQFIDINSYIAVSSNVTYFLFHIWTVFTYMFVHYEIFHILFNMLMLYWFGKIFLLYFTSKNFVSVYLLGGISGAALYILSFNIIPYFILQGNNFLVGASASVMAIIFAASFYNPKLEVRLLFFGGVKIIYIALAIFILDFISLKGDNNIGGHVAHIGGAIVGYIFARQFVRGKDLTKNFNRIIDCFFNLFKKKPVMKVKYNNYTQNDFKYNEKRYQESTDIDAILDKIKLSGYKSLSDDEKKRLFDASKK